MRGTPDYDQPGYYLASRLVDLGMIAHASMKIASVDNRGRVVFFDHFENGIEGWQYTIAGDATAPYAQTAYAEVPPCCIRLPLGTLAGGGYSEIGEFIQANPSNRVGFQASLSMENTPAHVFLYVVIGTGAASYYGSVRYDIALGKMSINTGGGLVQIASVAAASIYHVWLPIKIVVDFDLLKYVRAVIGSVNIDLSSYALEVNGAITEDVIKASVQAQPTNNAGDYALVGHVIITLDEP